MKMFQSALILVSMGVASQSFAGPECTKEAKDKWKDEKAFQKSLTDEGYKIKKFKVTSGSCYEIYGHNKEGKKVEIYFNPVTGDKVKEEIEGK
ncbi:MAG: PepSY domain-containing protein [Proteobacteria bacterium]|nr:PepSY domain-containing protein [Pseudomonadota bacterium]